MCGFVGEISRTPSVDRTQLYRMNNLLVHRGPDESGIVLAPDRRWGVAHRRLCVIDIEGGKQPMVDAERGLTLVYNGEIYDHDHLRRDLAGKGFSFRTTSDTEVLLALYAIHGLEFLDYLRGEFSFAIIDERKREAILVRDRMGLKPLFYARLSKKFLFASEIKALFAAPELGRRFDPTDLTASIAMGSASGRTVFRGVEQVRHAHYLRVRLDDLEISEHRYWDALANRRTDLPIDPGQQTEMVREEVDRAISLRLRADVPVGTYLSGGLDSSLVTATMAQRMDRLEAFGLSFEDSPSHDEFGYAQSIARRYPNLHLHRIPVTHGETLRRLPETVWHLERPFGNLHSVAKIMQSQYAREHVVCVLTGDGGDEAFCGYTTFWLQQALQEANYSLPVIRGRLRSMKKEASQIGGNRYYLAGGLATKDGRYYRDLTKKLGFPPCDLATALDSEQMIVRLMHPDFLAGIEDSPTSRLIDRLALAMPPADSLSHATLLQYVQLNSTVPEYISTMADRSEWAGSVEARPPLFDHKVVELAMGLPIEMKLRGDREKYVLRQAYENLLPKEVIERRKQAFLAPPVPFGGPEGRALLERYLSSAAVKEAGIWHPAKITALKLGGRLMPRNRILNVALTVVLTVQILHDQFINLNRFRR